MRTRRVLHLVSGDLWAGAEVMVYSLFAALAGNRDVELMALCLNDGVLARKLTALGCDVHVIPERTHGFPEIVAGALNRYRRSGVDVLHSHRVKQHLLGSLLSKALRIPALVATVHGLPEPNGRNDPRPVAERAKRLLDRLLIGRAFRTVVVVSREMHNQLNGRELNVRGELIQIHNGIRIPEVKLPSPPTSRCVIGSVGRLVPVKDYRLFLATAAAISRVDSSIHFEILGDGPERGAIIDCAAQFGLASRFTVRPSVEDPQAFYRTLALYLNTSVHEGCPLSILEAMASERAIVAPAVGGIPEIVQSGDDGHGWLSPTRDPDVLARGCLDLLADPARRGAMGQRGRARVMREFSAERMAEAYTATYLR